MKQLLQYGFLFFAAASNFETAIAQIMESTKETVVSPDKKLSFTFYQRKLSDHTIAMFYSVTYNSASIISESELDIQLDNNLSERAMALPVDKHTRWCENLVMTAANRFSKDTTWTPACGERSAIKDKYNSLVIHLIKDDNPIYKVDLEIRMYNEGAAFRYFFPENVKGTYYRIMAENTAFTMPKGTKAWHTSWAQGPYRLFPLNEWPDESERPLTLQLPGGIFVCLAEAQGVDYSRTKFKLSSNKPNTVVTSMYTPADLISPFATPWRVILVGERAGDIIEHNYLLLNLNSPSKIKDTTWIRPGKIMRVTTVTTKGALENIDFAVKHKLQYILFDWKWYGNAFSFASDATKVAIPDFDLPAIINYGKSKGVGVWLYCNMQALLAQSDSLFSIYHDWGVKGVKFGFVQVGSHRWTTWIEDMFKKAAKNKIMVNVHDDWRPTGEQRTWPNVMTAEGVRGNEEMPDAAHNTVLPFTRYVAGAADYTICYFDKRIKTTHAHQLALAAIYYSPLQTLYWYDKPSSFENEPELEFWDNIPTSWDETIVLKGAPGEFISTARKKGSDWFVGTITNNDERQMQLRFDFLEKKKLYAARFYTDDDSVKTKTKVKTEVKMITAETVVDIKLKAAGGLAIWISPK